MREIDDFKGFIKHRIIEGVMKRDKHYYLEWLLPNWCLELAYTIVVNVRYLVRKKEDSVLNLKKHEAEHLIVMANGPSLKTIINENIDILCSQDTMAVNFFAQSKYFRIIKPKYYVLMDTIFYVSEMNESVRKLLKYFDVDWDMKVITICRSEKGSFVDQIINSRHLEVVKCSDMIVPDKYFTEKKRMHYLSKDMIKPYAQNVINASLILAVTMLYKKIYLVGSEFSYLGDMVNVPYTNKYYWKKGGNDNHFYDDKEESEIDLDQLEEEKNGNGIGIYNIAQALLYDDFADRYASQMECKIYNCTELSWVDSFDRISLKDVFG